MVAVHGCRTQLVLRQSEVLGGSVVAPVWRYGRTKHAP